MCNKNAECRVLNLQFPILPLIFTVQEFETEKNQQ